MAEQINPSEKEIIKLNEKIAKYTPGSTFRFEREKPKELPEVLRIGLFGAPGVGKSALINSLNFATMGKPESDDDASSWAGIAQEGYKHAPSKTVNRVGYQVANCIEVYDNRGMNQVGGKFLIELGHQIAGARGDSERVEWNVGFFASLVPSLDRAFLASKDCDLHCTVLVISALNLSIKPKDLKELVDQIVKMTGSPPVVILTHRKQSGVREAVISEFLTGMQSQGFDHFFELENYTRDNHQYDPEKHLLLLQILEKCIQIGDRVMRFKEKSGGCIIL